MSKIYSNAHRVLQDQFDTRRLADTVESIILHDTIQEDERAFIESRDLFFLSTIDDQGRPSVSYKGGNKGFVRVVDEHTLAFPSYDGNGMFLSMGNISANSKVGLLFIDFEQPHRLRAYGEASVSDDDPLLKEYPESQLIVRVKVTQMWRNCPRYIHSYTRTASARHVPQANKETPLPDWKKLDALQPVLPKGDQEKVQAHGGTISMEELATIEQRQDS